MSAELGPAAKDGSPAFSSVRRALAAIAFALLAPLALPVATASANAGRDGPDPAVAAQCDAALTRAARLHGAPERLMRAISHVESGRAVGGRIAAWPWTVNVAGQGYYFDTRAEATRFVKAQLAQGARSFDVGCFQINYRWHGAAFPSVEAMFDPSLNADYAARFLVSLARETGDWMQAAGYYHSRTPEHFDRYTTALAHAYARLGAEGPGPIVSAAAAPSSQGDDLAARRRHPRVRAEPQPPRKPERWEGLLRQASAWDASAAPSAAAPPPGGVSGQLYQRPRASLAASALSADPPPTSETQTTPPQGSGFLRRARPLF